MTMNKAIFKCMNCKREEYDEVYKHAEKHCSYCEEKMEITHGELQTTL